MSKIIISEEQIRIVLDKILNEQISKVNRQEFNRAQFKLEELENCINETLKEARKVEDSIPDGLKSLMCGRIDGIVNNLSNSQKLITQLKEKVRKHKKSTFKNLPPTEEIKQ